MPDMLLTFLLILLGLHIFIQAFSLLILFRKDKDIAVPAEFPMISIWVAARNEEEHIIRCLESLNKLEYPEDKVEILIGNDHSTDQTSHLVKEFITNKPHFRLIDIGENMGKARGKANVLAWLAHESKGDYYLLADADVTVEPQWAKQHMAAFTKSVGTVSGTTVIEEKDLFAMMQSLDWLYFMGQIKVFADMGLPCTAVGNNMSVRKEAYWQTGGYEQIDFSITEDYKLFSEILKKGWDFRHLLTAKSTNISAPAPAFADLMKQRKRWLNGGKEINMFWKLIIVLLALFFPAFVVLLFIDWKLAITLWFARLILQSITLIILRKRSGRAQSVGSYILYEFYSTFLTLITPVYMVLPSGRVWKGRRY